MEYSQIIQSLEQQLAEALSEIEKAEKLDEKVKLSTIVKNMCESLSLFSTIPSSGYQANDIDENVEAEINNVIDDKFA